MKTLKWFKESDLIPDGATFIKEKYVVDRWVKSLRGWRPAESHDEYLYDVPAEGDKELTDLEQGYKEAYEYGEKKTAEVMKLQAALTIAEAALTSAGAVEALKLIEIVKAEDKHD